MTKSPKGSTPTNSGTNPKVVNLDGTPFQNIHFPPIKEIGETIIGVSTDFLSNKITDHGRQIAMLGYNQYVKVEDIEVNGDASRVTIKIFEEPNN